jgi:hypothetical protein
MVLGSEDSFRRRDAQAQSQRREDFELASLRWLRVSASLRQEVCPRLPESDDSLPVWPTLSEPIFPVSI